MGQIQQKQWKISYYSHRMPCDTFFYSAPFYPLKKFYWITLSYTLYDYIYLTIKFDTLLQKYICNHKNMSCMPHSIYFICTIAQHWYELKKTKTESVVNFLDIIILLVIRYKITNQKLLFKVKSDILSQFSFYDMLNCFNEWQIDKFASIFMSILHINFWYL